MLRCATWLAPGLPLGLFELVSTALASTLESESHLESRTERSGPDPNDDPFARDELDLGFMCAPSYRNLVAHPPVSVRLLEAAAVFDDPRNNDQPRYFSELVVRDDIEATSLADLAGLRIGFNDHLSLSGLGALHERKRQLGLDESFAKMVHTGGHRRSLEQLDRGELDAAAIDSNTLLDIGGVPSNLRVVETWGPFPVQPIVVRATLGDDVRRVMTERLLALHDDPEVGPVLRQYRVKRYAPVTEAAYR